MAITKTNITGINSRAQSSDVHSTAGTDNPVRRPSSGTNYSFWVSTRLSVDAITGGTINNLKWYTDGTNNFGTGITCKVAKASTGAGDGYRVATGTVGETGTLLNTTNHTGLDAAPADAFTFTSGSPLSLTGSTSATGDLGDFAVFQLEIGTTAGTGTSTQETFTFAWDSTTSSETVTIRRWTGSA